MWHPLISMDRDLFDLAISEVGSQPPKNTTCEEIVNLPRHLFPLRISNYRWRLLGMVDLR